MEWFYEHTMGRELGITSLLNNFPDDYFVSNIERVDSVTLLRKDKLLTGRDVSWTLRWLLGNVFFVDKGKLRNHQLMIIYVVFSCLYIYKFNTMCATPSRYLGSDSPTASQPGRAWTSWGPSHAPRRCAGLAKRGRRPRCCRCSGNPTTGINRNKNKII